MFIIGIDTITRGTSNQIKGLIIQAQQSEDNLHNMFLPIENLVLSGKNNRYFHPRYYDNLKQFREELLKSVKTYFDKKMPSPDIAVLPFDQSLGEKENVDIDQLSKLLKESFEQFGLKIKTFVLASNLYNYKYVDYIHVGAHQLSQNDEISLLSNKELAKRVILTLGVPSDLTKMQIKLAAHHNETLRNMLEKYAYCPTVLYSLGGKTADDIIKFSLKDAKKILDSAVFFADNGYKIIITNSPRTPDDVTDYLYEECEKKENIVFYNCKNIAFLDEEKQNFRFYNGKYKKEFSQIYEGYGNIYPAVLDICDFVVNTHDSFSYTSDVASLGIPSVVYTGNEIGPSRSDCHKLFSLCQAAGHTMSLDEAILKVQKGEKIETRRLTKISKQIIDALKSKDKAN